MLAAARAVSAVPCSHWSSEVREGSGTESGTGSGSGFSAHRHCSAGLCWGLQLAVPSRRSVGKEHSLAARRVSVQDTQHLQRPSSLRVPFVHPNSPMSGQAPLTACLLLHEMPKPCSAVWGALTDTRLLEGFSTGISCKVIKVCSAVHVATHLINKASRVPRH